MPSKKPTWMKYPAPTEEQEKAYQYCVENAIRISPIAAESGPKPSKYFVGVSDPRDYKKVYKSRFQYDEDQIWDAVYDACLYYYLKRKL